MVSSGSKTRHGRGRRLKANWSSVTQRGMTPNVCYTESLTGTHILPARCRFNTTPLREASNDSAKVSPVLLTTPPIDSNIPRLRHCAKNTEDVHCRPVIQMKQDTL